MREGDYPVETELTSVRHRRQLLLWLIAALLALGGVGVFGYFYRQNVSEQNARNSERQDYALCVAQNSAREANRTTASATYALVAGVLRTGGPEDPTLKRVFKTQEQRLARQLQALRPLDCETYVRPDLPPDQGHG